MSSHTKRIGEIGECAIVYNLMKIDGVGVSKSVGDNLPYDLIIAEGQKFVCYTTYNYVTYSKVKLQSVAILDM